ncbi:MAG TPA: hypothetical protein VG826_12585 [Pirellulales bacterium]|nr:hypothetical protein [Pirellulales bacterium]
MSDFDAYTDWLKIPADRRPPTHYDLLGLAQAEADADRIYRAAMDRMALVRRYHLGARAADALRLQNEISRALDCLRNPDQKRRYDEQILSKTIGGQTINGRFESTSADVPAAGSTPPDNDRRPSQAPGPSGDRRPQEALTGGVRLASKPAPTVPVPRTSPVWPWLVLSAVGVVSVAGMMGVMVFKANRTPSADDTTEVVASASEASALADKSMIDASAGAESQEASSGDEAATLSEGSTTDADGGEGSVENHTLMEGQVVDLLSLIDPTRDAVAGNWERHDDKLITGEFPHDRLEIPFDVPAEYKLTLVVSCRRHREGLHLGLVVGGKQVLVILDGWSKTTNCLDMIDGEHLKADGGSVRLGRFLEDDAAPNVITCEVRANRVSVQCNQLPVIDWTGDFKRLSLDPVWNVRGSGHLFIGSWDTPFEISKIELSALER